MIYNNAYFCGSVGSGLKPALVQVKLVPGCVVGCTVELGSIVGADVLGTFRVVVAGLAVLGREVELGLAVVHSHGRDVILLLPPVFGRGVVACVLGILISGPSTKI